MEVSGIMTTVCSQFQIEVLVIRKVQFSLEMSKKLSKVKTLELVLKE